MTNRRRMFRDRIPAHARLVRESSGQDDGGERHGAIPIWLLFGIFGAWIATTKGRSGCGWFILCSILGPIGLIIAAVISKKS